MIFECDAEIDSIATAAAQHSNINQVTLVGTADSFPRLLKQQRSNRRIVSTAFDEETQRLAAIYERKLAALEALKKSLLHQAFTGEL